MWRPGHDVRLSWDTHLRSIASQILVNPEGRIPNDFAVQFAATWDEKFVTARLGLLALRVESQRTVPMPKGVKAAI